MVPVFILTALLSWFLALGSRGWAYKIGAIDQPRGGRKIHQKPTPLLGGLGIEVSAVGVAGLYRDFLDTFVIDIQDADQRERLEHLGLSVIVTNTIMSDVERSENLARVTVEHGQMKTMKNEELRMKS